MQYQIFINKSNNLPQNHSSIEDFDANDLTLNDFSSYEVYN